MAFLIAASALLASADLPDNIPIPEARPEPVPLPNASDADKQPEAGQIKPGEAMGHPEGKGETAREYVPPPIEKEDPARLAACLAELKMRGVAFEEIPASDDGNGCGIDKPITVTSLGNGVALKPGGKMRCETARQLTLWTHDVVEPMLKTVKPDESLAALNLASAYVCRKRNGVASGKISEHARGNAADIAGLTFKSGNTFSIEPRMKDPTLDGAFQRAITAAACLYFTTVLDPGSDAAHETHLHLDVIKRSGGYRYCW